MVDKAHKIFVVGIGGIGISALSKILKETGKDVAGSDLASSEITESLVDSGLDVKIGHKEQNLPTQTELLIYSMAVPENNPERKKANKLGIPELSYPEALGELTKKYEKIIAVAGTNGKTTTTAMIGWIMQQAGLNPTVLVGSKVLAWNSNARIGGHKYLILEADEYRRAFLNYLPDIAIITNIELDHLDYFKDLDDIKNAFAKFASQIKPHGELIYNENNENTQLVTSRSIGSHPKVIVRPFSTAEAIHLQVPGKFNQENAAAAAEACRALGIPNATINKALANFTGTWRRFEKIGRVGETDIISDYAHHPAGIVAVSEAATEVYQDISRILLVFQPHQHNRTKNLFTEFVRAFCSTKIENFIISEIFDVAGREESEDQNISSRDVVREMKKCGKNAEYASDLTDCEKKVRQVIGNYDVVIFVGAGDIYKIANNLAK